MKKLLLASLLTAAVMFGAAKKRTIKPTTENAHKSGPGDEGPTAKTKKGGGGAGKVSTAESTHAIGSATGGAGSGRTATTSNKSGNSKLGKNYTKGKKGVNKAGQQPPPKRPAAAPPAK